MKKLMTSILFTLIVLAALLAGSTAAFAEEAAEATQTVETVKETKKAKKIKASVKIVNKGKIALGDKVTLKATVKGVKNVEHEVKWQVKVDGEWKDIEGATGLTYAFTVTEQNAGNEWRVAVVTE